MGLERKNLFFKTKIDMFGGIFHCPQIGSHFPIFVRRLHCMVLLDSDVGRFVCRVSATSSIAVMCCFTFKILEITPTMNILDMVLSKVIFQYLLVS